LAPAGVAGIDTAKAPLMNPTNTRPTVERMYSSLWNLFERENT
jgi:hypothetical protein